MVLKWLSILLFVLVSNSAATAQESLGEFPDEIMSVPITLAPVSSRSIETMTEDEVVTGIIADDSLKAAGVGYDELYLMIDEGELFISFIEDGQWYVTGTFETYIPEHEYALKIIDLDNRGYFEILMRTEKRSGSETDYEVEEMIEKEYLLISIDDNLIFPLLKEELNIFNYYTGFRTDTIAKPTKEDIKREALELKADSNWISETNTFSFDIVAMGDGKLEFENVLYERNNSITGVEILDNIFSQSYKLVGDKLKKALLIPDLSK